MLENHKKISIEKRERRRKTYILIHCKKIMKIYKIIILFFILTMFATNLSCTTLKDSKNTILLDNSPENNMIGSDLGIEDKDINTVQIQIKLLNLVNDARSKSRNCGSMGYYDSTHPLKLDDRLNNAAQLHSEDMRTYNFLSHTGSDDSSPSDRISAQNYPWLLIGETIAAGQTTPESAIESWLKSNGHCAIIMSNNYYDMGAGNDERYWTLNFGRQRIS